MEKKINRINYTTQEQEEMAIARHNRRLLRKLKVGDIIVPMSGVDGYDRYEIVTNIFGKKAWNEIFTEYMAVNGRTFFGEHGKKVDSLIEETLDKVDNTRIWREALVYLGADQVISYSQRAYTHVQDIDVFVEVKGPRTKAKVKAHVRKCAF